MNALYMLDPKAVAIVEAGSKGAILDAVAQTFAHAYELDAAEVLAAINEREQLGSTGFGRGAAIPHARLPGLHRPVAAFLRLAAPVAFDAADGQPVDLVFGLLSPDKAGATHLHALAAISRLLRDERIGEAVLEAPNAEAIYGLLSNVAERDAA